MDIGKRMRELREKAGITQAEIAKLCGSNQTTIAKMEAGHTRITAQILVWWADYFDVSLDYLCCRTDKPQGILYECKKPQEAVVRDKEQFVKDCFTLNTKENLKLRELLSEAVGLG